MNINQIVYLAFCIVSGIVTGFVTSNIDNEPIGKAFRYGLVINIIIDIILGLEIL